MYNQNNKQEETFITSNQSNFTLQHKWSIYLFVFYSCSVLKTSVDTGNTSFVSLLHVLILIPPEAASDTLWFVGGTKKIFTDDWIIIISVTISTQTETRAHVSSLSGLHYVGGTELFYLCINVDATGSAPSSTLWRGFVNSLTDFE